MYNPTYTKSKYAYAFQCQWNGFQYPSWNGFEDTTLGPIRQYSHHKKNFIEILYSDHHWTTMCGKSLNEVFMLPILVVAWKMKWYNCFQNIQVYIRFFKEYLPHWCLLNNYQLMLIVVSNVKVEKEETFSSTYSSELNWRWGGGGESFSSFGKKLMHLLIRVN